MSAPGDKACMRRCAGPHHEWQALTSERGNHAGAAAGGAAHVHARVRKLPVHLRSR